MIEVAGWRTATGAGQSRDADGTLVLGGVRADELARIYGTPALILDRAVLEESIAVFTREAAASDIEIAYAGKALLFSDLVNRFARTPLALDVCSLGELYVAERGGFPAARMYLHGCGKTDEELQAVVDGRVAASIVDNIFELERLAALEVTHPVKILLRVNAGIEAHTHEFVRTGGENTKFGFSATEFARALALLERAPQLRLIGIHSHIGSNILELTPFLENVDATMTFVLAAARAGHPVERMILGGGFGIDEDGAEALDLGVLFPQLRARADAATRAAGLGPLHLGVEPGRAVVARAGTSLYRVVAVKQFGKRRFVIVDGGMADNPRPALYDAVHRPLVAHSSARGQSIQVTICGRSCENDELGDAQLPEDLSAGDLVVLSTTGAYTASMASNYNRFPRPPILWVYRGEHSLAVRRETLDDLVRTEIL